MNEMRDETKKYQLYKGVVNVLLVTVLAACSTQPDRPVSEQSSESPVSEPLEKEYVYDKNFMSGTLYSLLVAEMAINRKRYDIALGNYTQQAGITRDINIISRATQISQILKARQDTLEMVSLWMELDPDNAHAEQILVSELVHAGRIDEAYKRSVVLLEQGYQAPFDSIAAQKAAGDMGEVRQLEEQYRALRKTYPGVNTLQLGHSYLLQQVGNLEESLQVVKKAKSDNPGQIQIGMQEVRVLEQMGREEDALESMDELVSHNPENIGLRARYARKLADSDLEASQAQFEVLHEKVPENGEILLSLALVSKQRGSWEESLVHFKKLVERNQHWSLSYFHIGDINERLERYQEAIQSYKEVLPGKEYIEATMSVVRLMSAHFSSQDALEFIQERKRLASQNEKPQFILMYSEVLSRSGQLSAAERALSEGIDEYPESVQLLYARAMVFTKIDYIEAAEKDLKKIIEGSPNNATALNALGYTLADRTDRFQEAHDYISRAFELAPTDPAVLDSLGWVAFRMGNMEEALVHLKKAMELMPDHEIAAHLGEVLWVTGSKEQAIEVWKQGLKLKPDSKVLHSTFHRLDVKLD